MVTLDTRLFAWRERDIQNAFLPFLYNEGMANYFSDPVFLELAGNPEEDKMKTLMHFAACFSNPSSEWSDLSFIKDCTKLPLIVKGIQHPEDAKSEPERSTERQVLEERLLQYASERCRSDYSASACCSMEEMTGTSAMNLSF